MAYTTKDAGSAFEKMVAEYLGWDVVAGSGAAPCHPGDLKSDAWLAECKTHMKSGNRIAFLKSVWHKIKDEAASKFRFPVLFADDGSQVTDKTWCMFSLDVSSADEAVCLTNYGKSIFKLSDTRITFDHMRAKADYRFQTNDNDTSKIVYVLEYDSGKVGICPLEVFRDLFIA